MEISHLVVNGCSFTRCQGITNPDIDGWPALLAKKLNVPVVNLAKNGSGCDGIYRRTLEHFYDNLNTNSKPFYIISWSAATRREEFFHVHEIDGIVDDYHGVHVVRPETALEKELAVQYASHTTLQAAEKRKYNYWVSIINLFENHGVPYRMNDAIPALQDMRLYLEHNSSVYNACMKNPYKILDYPDLFVDGYRLPCGHINEEGNKIMAEYMYNTINP